MDWRRFANPLPGEAFKWRKVMGVPTTHVGGRRVELFKEPVWQEWRHVPMWGYRISGVDQAGRFKTMRQAKAQAELHARRLAAAGKVAATPAAVPAEVVTRPRPKRQVWEKKAWW